jgi:hypothetical protein
MPAFALHCRSAFKLAAFLLLVPLAAHGHGAPAFDEEVGFLGVRRERVAGERWDEGERNILTGLALYKLVNV